VGTDYGKTTNAAHITTEWLPTSNRIRCPHGMESPAHIDRNMHKNTRSAKSVSLSNKGEKNGDILNPLSFYDQAAKAISPVWYFDAIQLCFFAKWE
jgi:hypothetical protein